MIYTEMSGRLGNQMFRYAFTRWLQLKSPQGSEEITFDFSNIAMERAKGEMDGWEDSLQHFQPVSYAYYEKCTGQEATRPYKSRLNAFEKGLLFYTRALGLIGRKRPDIRLKLTKPVLPILNKHGIYQLFIGHDYDWQYTPTPNKFVLGPFECARYPEEIRETLLQEFTPEEAPLEKNSDLYKRIAETESVCITIRRGNFVKYPKLDVCTTAYFEAAIKTLRKKLQDPVFFIFSDDVQWTKENIRIDDPDGRHVYYESGDDPIWEKLRLMYSCKHFIIANSTFSWWAQFLSRNEDKIVVAPDPWFNDVIQPDLYEDGWILLHEGVHGKAHTKVQRENRMINKKDDQ